MDFLFGKGEADLRNELINKLDLIEHYGEKKFGLDDVGGKKVKDKENDDDEDQDGPTSAYDRHQYSDEVRWSFYNGIIDKEVQVTMFSNGYVEFYSPRLQKRFIEKFYDINQDGKIKGTGYGHATYVIDNDEYLKNRSQLVDDRYNVYGIVVSEMINEKYLRYLVPRGKDRIPHVTQSIDKNWMRMMVSKFGSCYSEAEQDLLEKHLSELENQHEILA